MEEGGLPRSKIYIEIDGLSAKQRGAVLGLIKDMGFEPEEISEVVVVLTEAQETVQPGRHPGKRK